jgi:hypothetical protein
MTDCPCDEITEYVPNIPAGLDALPRQPWSFPEVRTSLLREVGTQIPTWLASDAPDLGVMWLEMWAYVSDVLAFYDERIANESYLRTAHRRPSLRRHVELLGYLPKPGVAGSIAVALEADGRRPVDIPENTGFRSEAFGAQPPQVYELTSGKTIDPLCNQWSIGAIRKNALPDHPPSLAEHPEYSPSPSDGETAFFVFETENFSLAKDRLVVFQGGGITNPGVVSRVTEIKPFEGRDGKSYVEVHVDPPVQIPYGTPPDQVRVWTPTISARRTEFFVGASVSPVSSTRTSGLVYLDSIYRQLSLSGLFIASLSPTKNLLFSITRLAEIRLSISEENLETKIPVTAVSLNSSIPDEYLKNRDQLTFHFSMVDGGKVTTVPSLDISRDDLAYGVPLEGLVEPPVSARKDGTGKVLEQTFLLKDANDVGVFVKGILQFDQTHRAKFTVTEVLQGTLDTLKAPIAVFGNVTTAFQGESVFDEVLGSGDLREVHQTFQLAQKPLTYTDATANDGMGRSTLKISVNGVRWDEVRSFYGMGPEDQVYVVRHDDEQNTFVTFGDGLRGARLPTGVDNIVADYRYGASSVAVPAGVMNQLARPAEGLVGVRGPVVGTGGRDPEDSTELRTKAPRSMLLFGSAVGLRDFECVASLCQGVDVAKAEYDWLELQGQSGVRLSYIGNAKASDVLTALREKAEPNLNIVVEPAKVITSELHLSIAVATAYDFEAVKKQVSDALREPNYGLLSRKQASIGGSLWISKLYEVVLSIPGVTAVMSGTLYRQRWPQPLEGTDTFCAPLGSYFDFSGENGLVLTKAKAQ